MVEITIPDNVFHKWHKLLQEFEPVVGHAMAVCTSVNHNIFQPVAISDNSIDLIKNTIEVDSFSKDVLAHGELFTKESEINGYHYVTGLPIQWLSKAQFGVLLVLCEEEGLRREKQLFLGSIISLIEKDLIEIYQNAHLSYQTEKAMKVKQYPAPDFQRFIDSFKDHIWVKDINGIYTHGNREIEIAWGKPLSQIVGKTDEELFDREIAEKFADADNQVLKAGKQLVVEECANQSGTDSKTWLETIKTPLVDSDGQFVGIVGMTRNVTNRKAIEDQLLVASTVFENSVEGVIITNREGVIIYVNRAFCDITGYAEPEAIGRNPRFLKSGRHEESFYRDLWLSLLTEGKWKGELWNRRKDGAIYPELSTISAVYDKNKDICNFVAVFTDISQQKQHEHDLLHMAYHDPLTDLPNRSKLTTQIEQEISHARRSQGRFATIFIDVDHFKHINDSYGHLAGDEVLCEVASRLSGKVREEDTVSRIGGDEFVVLLPGIRDLDAVSIIVQKLMSVFDKPVELGDRETVRLTGSMGVALYPEDGEDSDLLLSNADAAMYRAKQTGRNNYAYYTESLTKDSEAHLKIQGAMHDALENDLFHLEYQPQVDMETSRLIGLESLIRWHDPKLGFVSPVEFIPIAEKTGMIQEIGLWVLRTACQQGVEWLDKGYRFGRIAVNVAGPQLQRDNFAEQVVSILEETGLDAKYLELEVTEGFMVKNSERSVNHLKMLRNFGIELSMDDFGTGYSSLSYLQQLPLNKIKIDRSFVMNLPKNTHDVAIADAIIAMGNALSLKVVAEGVETREQADFLVQRGCSQAQGYYFSKPRKPEDLIVLLEQQKIDSY